MCVLNMHQSVEPCRLRMPYTAKETCSKSQPLVLFASANSQSIIRGSSCASFDKNKTTRRITQTTIHVRIHITYINGPATHEQPRVFVHRPSGVYHRAEKPDSRYATDTRTTRHRASRETRRIVVSLRKSTSAWKTGNKLRAPH